VPLPCLRPSFGRLVVSQMCHSGQMVVPRPKIVKKLSKKMVKKLSKSCQKAVKKLSKNAKSCQKVVKKLQKIIKEFKIHQTVVGGEKVVSRPSASASLTGQRQKKPLN
jgi:uncharacterized membrane protein